MSYFVPERDEKRSVALRISLEKLKRIDELAGTYHLSRHAFINQCIDYATANIKYGEAAWK